MAKVIVVPKDLDDFLQLLDESIEEVRAEKGSKDKDTRLSQLLDLRDKALKAQCKLLDLLLELAALA